MVLSGMNFEGKQFAYELDVEFERKKSRTSTWFFVSVFFGA